MNFRQLFCIVSFFSITDFGLFSSVSVPKPILFEFMKRDTASSALVDYSYKFEDILRRVGKVSVVRFLFDDSNNLVIENLSKSLPEDLRDKVCYFRANGVRLVSFLAKVASSGGFDQLKFPLVMFFDRANLVPPFEDGDLSEQALFATVRDRLKTQEGTAG